MVNNKRLRWTAIKIVVAVSFLIRLDQINSVRYCDELIYEKLARFIFNGHLASSSSHYAIYATHNATLSLGTEVQIVEPWVDHPPLFSILLIPFWLKGIPRLLPILLSTLSTFLIIYLLRKNFTLSLLSGLIFAFFPSAVRLNSMVFLDNGTSFFFLLTLALTSRYEEQESRRLLVLSGVSAGLSFLCKISGVFAIIYLALYLLFTNKLRRNFFAFIVALCISAIYPISNLMLNADLFLDILTVQKNRLGVFQFLSTGLSPAVSDFTYTRNMFTTGSISVVLLLSWISLGAFLNSRNNKVVKLGILSFVLTFLIISYAWFFSWIPMYPFFSIALAYVLHRIFRGVIHLLKTIHAGDIQLASRLYGFYDQIKKFFHSGYLDAFWRK